jgi:molybdopterin converting factor small subunit
MATLIPNYDLAEKIGDRIEIDASTVGDLIEEGVARWGEIFRQATKRASISVNGRAISHLNGSKTPLAATDTVWFVLPSGGG